MFFKEIELKRNGIAWKLYHFVFPWAPRYDNYCPFFWLTILAGILFPFIIPFWVIWKVIKFIGILILSGFELFGQLLDTMLLQSLENSLYSLSEEDTEKFLRWRESSSYARSQLPVCERKRFKKIYTLYIKLTGKVNYDVDEKLQERVKADHIKFDWNTWIKECEVRNEAYKKKQELIEKRRQERIQKIDQTARNTASAMIPFAKVFSIVLVPLCAWLLWQIGKGLGWCWYWIIYFFAWCPWSKILVALEYIGLVILYLAIAAGIIWLLFILFRKIFSAMSFKGLRAPSWLCISWQWIYHRIFSPFGHFVIFCLLYIGSIFVNYFPKFFESIGKFFGFFWAMIVAWKNKNCPTILWKD
jgi:hypothetical protein